MKSAKVSGKTIEDILNELVTAGTLTSAQKEAVISVIPEKKTASNRENRFTNKLESLVTDGTITEDQLTAIQTSIDKVFKSN